jgi:hypothetical protein
MTAMVHVLLPAWSAQHGPALARVKHPREAVPSRSCRSNGGNLTRAIVSNLL